MPFQIKVENSKLPDINRLLKDLTDPQALFPLVQANAKVIAQRIAGITPVDKTGGGGGLKSSWQGDAMISGPKVTARVYNTDPRVQKGLLNLLYYGSRAHIIKPYQKKALGFNLFGKDRAFAKVKHLGTQPNLRFRIGSQNILKQEADNLKKSILKLADRAKQ